MKRFLSILLAAMMLLSLSLSFASCGKSGEEEKGLADEIAEKNKDYDWKKFEGKTLNVYNWGEYISDGSEDSIDVNVVFEQLTGMKVNYTTYESNEQMYAKLKSGSVSYDVIIPSDYMIQRLAKEGMLKELDYSKIPNYKNIEDKYKGMYYDPDEKYTAAYNVGYLGLIYNTTMVEGTPDSWTVMWDPQYKGQVLNIDNSRDGFMIGQVVAGVDVNSENKADWDKASDKLKELHENLQGYVMDGVFDKMEQGNAAIAPYYAGDFLTMKEENDDLEMIYPKEGTNVFVDALCIPSCVENYEAALMYINFMLDGDIALANAEYIRYASPNTEVLNDPEYTLKDDEYIYPEVEPKAFYYYDLPSEIIKYYDELWLKVKG